MAFKIDTYPTGGYTISAGGGRLICAKDLQAVVYALEHYFNTGVPGYSVPFDNLKHIAHNRIDSCCPLCAWRQSNEHRNSL